MLKVIDEKEYIEVNIPITSDYFRKHKIPITFLNKRFSPSFIKVFNECPAKSFLRVLKPATSRAIDTGNEVHKALEEFDSKELTKDQLLTKYPNIKNYLQSYFNLDSLVPENKDKRILTEKKYVLKYGDIELSGIIDKIIITNDDIYIIDYKTSKKPVNIQWYYTQLVVYYLLVTNFIDCTNKKVHVGLCWITQNDAGYEWLIITEDDIKQFNQNINIIFEEIKSFMITKQLKKNINPSKCRYCNLCNWNTKK